MTFLEIIQRLADECGLASRPVSALNQTGEFLRLVEWASQAYVEIQNRADWRWMRHGFTLDTTQSVDAYAFGAVNDAGTAAPITRFAKWRLNDCEDPPKIYLTSSGIGTQTWMIWTPWEWFKTIYRIGTQNEGHPIHVTIDPQDRLVIGPVPNAVYTISGDYYRSAQVLADDADVPEMPEQYHMLIVYRAMEDYGFFESAPEVLARGEKKGRRILRQLETNQLPRMRLAGPMA